MARRTSLGRFLPGQRALSQHDNTKAAVALRRRRHCHVGAGVGSKGLVFWSDKFPAPLAALPRSDLLGWRFLRL